MEQPELIASFMGCTGANAEKAKQFLELTNNALEEAVALFFESGDQPPLNQAGGSSSNPDISVNGAGITRQSSTTHETLDGQVRAPDKSTRQRLVGNMSSVHPSGLHASSLGQLINDPFVDSAMQQIHQSAGSRSRDGTSTQFSTLFQPPKHLIFNGSFQDARQMAKNSQKWLLVNVQDHTEFASHQLNRDTWGDDVVQNVVASAFVFWQAYATTDEGQRYSQLYHISPGSFPHIGVIDPRTGQKMKEWSGFIDPQEMTMKLSDFCDSNSFDSDKLRPSAIKAHTGTMPPAAPATRSFDNMSEEEQLKLAIAQSMENDELGGKNNAITVDDSDEEVVDEVKPPAAAPVVEEVLPEEPAAGDGVTRVQIRTPDGKRLVRHIRESDPVNILFTFARVKVPEAKTRGFQLRIPYPPKSLEESSTTVEEAKLSNGSLILQFDV